MTDIPKPVSSGSAGTQQTGTPPVVNVTDESPLEGLPITRTVEGLAATRSRSMGGEVAANLIAGSFAQITYELQETKTELHETRNILRNTEEKLTAARIKVSVLTERVTTTWNGRHLKNLSIFAGTTITGVAIELYRSNLDKLAYVLGLLGGLLILLGWFSRQGGGGE